MTPAIVGVMTPPTIGVMPSKGTKRRTIRIDDELWDAVSRIAAEAGTTVSELLRAELERYVKKHGKQAVDGPETGRDWLRKRAAE